MRELRSVTYDVSFWLNTADDDGPKANVRMLVVVPEQESIDDEHHLAQQTAKDALRPFLNNAAYFGEWDPMPVHAALPSVDESVAPSAHIHHLQTEDTITQPEGQP